MVTKSSSLLERLPPEASEYALKALEKLKVKVHLEIDSEKLKTEMPDALFLPERTKIVTSFFNNSSFGGSLEPNGAIRVNSFMQVEGFRNVFAVGDCCVTPLKEEKGVFSTSVLGAIVFGNLVAKHEGTGLKTIPPRMEFVQGTLLQD